MKANIKKRTHNSTYKKLAVQWLNEALCFASSAVLADSFRLRNRQLLVAAKRCWQFPPFPKRKSISKANVKTLRTITARLKFLLS